MIKLVALDLDGTVVNENLKIAPRVQKVINHLVTQTDVRVVIATGRMFMSALPFAKELGIREPLISYQGAMIRNLDSAHSLRLHTPIALPLAGEVLTMLLKNRFDVNVYMDDQMWTRPDNRYAEFYMRTASVQPNYHDDLLARMTQAPTKLMVIDDERLDTLLAELGRDYVNRLSFCRSRSNFCEIIDSSASKWNALRTLADEWGILPEEIMAIGDQGNDLSMIAAAGIGVAMGNAPDEVKQAANYVTKPVDQDGVAEAVEQFVLGDMPIRNR